MIQKKSLAGPIVLLIIGICLLFVFVGIPIVIIALVMIVNRVNENNKIDAHNRAMMGAANVPRPNAQPQAPPPQSSQSNPAQKTVKKCGACGATITGTVGKVVYCPYCNSALKL